MLSVVAIATAIAMQAPGGGSHQSAFDAATKDAEAGRCAEAVKAFDTLAEAPQAKRSAIVGAAIAVRRGMCLMRLGRLDDGERSVRQGVGTLAQTPASFGNEARDAYLELAALAQGRLDYDTGIADASRALALSSGAERAMPLSMLATFFRFDGDGAAVRHSAEALELVQAMPGVTKQQIARQQVAAARALMAADRVKEADVLLKRALANNGGLTERSSLDDVATRYDLAQSALLRKQMGDARLYLAYTGAGRLGDAPFASADRIDVPQCGEVPGMTPDSYAVVEFGMSATGAVTYAEPVYAKGGRDAALAYARAVQSWAWSPEKAAAIPPFYRVLTRIEVRCTRSGEGGDIMAPLQASTAAWLEERGVAMPPDGAREATLIPRWRAAAAGSDSAALDANMRLAASPLSSIADRRATADRAAALAGTLGAPQGVRTHASLIGASLPQTTARSDRDWRREVLREEAALRVLLARPDVAGEPVGAATLRLRIAEVDRWLRKDAGDAAALVAAVAEARDLPDRHPLRINALLGQANTAAARNDLSAAAIAFDRTGLDEQQCALIGPKPTMTSSGASASLYPMELVQMGFEGWTRIEYDIAADGRTAQQRTLLAYPPFLFGDAAKAMIAKTRYARSYRPETSVACTANQQAFRFLLPK